MYESPLFGQTESLANERVHDPRTRFSTGRFHHLADEPSGEFWFCLHFSNLVGVLGNDAINGLLDSARVGYELHAARLDNRTRFTRFTPQNVEKILGDFARDHV